MLENFRKHKHGSIIVARLRYYCFRIVEKFCLGNCSTYNKTVYKMSSTKCRNTCGVSRFRLIRTGTGVVTETGVQQGSQRAYHAQL